MCTLFWSENQKGGGHSKDLVVELRITLKRILETGWEGVNWFHVAHDRDQWRALVNEPSGSIKSGEFLD